MASEQDAARNPDPQIGTGRKMKHTRPSVAQGDRASLRQVGALCWRMHRGRVEVLLITSRDTGRWVIPKGWTMEDRSDPEAAAREAWEEAGVTGDLAETSLGSYGYEKAMKPGVLLPCTIAVYPVRVGTLAEKFPERKERRRKWFPAVKAARKVAEPELRDILARLRAKDGALVIGPASTEEGHGALADP